MTRIAIEMPKVNYEMETGVVRAWLRQPGDRVAQGDVIAEIETDKALVELQAPLSGTLAEIIHPAGDEVEVRMPIGWLEIDG